MQAFAEIPARTSASVPEKVDVLRCYSRSETGYERTACQSTKRGWGRAAAGDAAKTAPHVTIRGLAKAFDKTVIYDNFDLDIPRGKFISVFGPTVAARAR